MESDKLQLDKLQLDKVDIEILYVMLVNKAISPMDSFSMKKIISKLQLQLSYYTILRRIKQKLIPLGYLIEGYKNGNSKNYYLSEAAIEYLKVNIIEKENVFEFEEIIEDEEFLEKNINDDMEEN